MSSLTILLFQKNKKKPQNSVLNCEKVVSYSVKTHLRLSKDALLIFPALSAKILF